MSDSDFTRALKAWHGSPHDFEEFRNEAIGSGEGTEWRGGYGIRGHGHYVAEERKVAESYRDSLTRRRAPPSDHSYMFNGVRNNSSVDGFSDFLGWLYNVRDWERRVKQSKAMIGPSTGEKTKEIVKQQSDELKNALADLHKQAIGLHNTPELMDLSLDQIQHLIDVDNDMRDPYSGGNPELALTISTRRRKEKASRNYRDGIGSADNVRAEHDAAEKAYGVLLPVVQKMEPAKPQQLEGRLYELNLNLGEHELLDWDAPLQDHHDEALSKILNIPEVDDATHFENEDENTHGWESIGGQPKLHPEYSTGQEVYNHLVNETGSAIKASNRLLEHDVKGIRYKDQGSRNFSPADVKVAIDGKPVDTGGKPHYAPNAPEQYAHLLKVTMDGMGMRSLQEASDHYKKIADDWFANPGNGNKDYIYESYRNMADWYEKNKDRVSLQEPKPTYNYVIFDPTAIKIMRKLGMKGETVKDFTDTGVHVKPVSHDPFKE